MPKKKGWKEVERRRTEWKIRKTGKYGQSPERMPAQSPERKQAQSQERMPPQSPERKQAQSLKRMPAQSPERKQVQSPERRKIDIGKFTLQKLPIVCGLLVDAQDHGLPTLHEALQSLFLSVSSGL